MRRALMGVLLCVSCDCGGAGDAELSVDLRTDYAPGIEFDIAPRPIEAARPATVGLCQAREQLST